MNKTYLMSPAKAWVKRKAGPDEIVRVVPDMEENGIVLCYRLYVAYGYMKDNLPDEKNPDYLGRILFDTNGYWIYDGDELSVTEQEQLAKFICGYVEHV